MNDSNDSDCELVIDEDETTLVSDEEVKAVEIVESIGEDNWHLFHPISISSSDMKDELFNDETNTCSICNETFRYNIGLLCHLEMEHLELKSKISKKTKSKKRKHAARTAVPSKEACPKAETIISKKIQCDVCRKSFLDNSKLLRHSETCSTKYSCVYCKSKFSWESKYKKHLFKIHKFNAVVICKYCSSVFADMVSLATHSISCERKTLSDSVAVKQIPQQS